MSRRVGSVDLKNRIAGLLKGLLLINDPEFKQMNQIWVYVCYSSFTFSYLGAGKE